MLCEKCRKNEATNFYHENVNGKVRSMRLCAECAKSLEESGDLPKLNADKFFEDFDFFDEPFFQNPVKTLNSLFSGFFSGEKALGSGNPSGEEKTAEKKCEGCGSTLRDFATRGAGCPKCFETFAEELAPTVSRAHGRTVHTGRAPAKFRDRIETKRKNEDFERAAEIRDELKKLRTAEPNEAVEA